MQCALKHPEQKRREDPRASRVAFSTVCPSWSKPIEDTPILGIWYGEKRDVWRRSESIDLFLDE